MWRMGAMDLKRGSPFTPLQLIQRGIQEWEECVEWVEWNAIRWESIPHIPSNSPHRTLFA